MADSQRPNILFIIDDQHHAGCLGFMGHPAVKTPNLDALAAGSAYFSNMFACSAICGPSRTSFHTGTYVRTHENFFMTSDIRRDLPSLPGLLSEAGYTSILTGKNHLPPKVSRHFHRIYGPGTYKRELDAAGVNKQPQPPVTNTHMQSYTFDLPDEWHIGTWTAQKAIDFLRSEEAKQQPFFVTCAPSPPHSPHCPPAKFEKLYDPADVPLDWDAYERFELSKLHNRPMIEDFWKLGTARHDPRIFQEAVCRYWALCSLVDHEVGRLLQTLDEAGLADDTIVIFTSDHGDFAGHHGQLGKNLPAYDELMRIPFIYHDPHRPADGGREVQGFYQNVDFMPTMLERLGLEIPPTVQGQSFLPALDGVPGSSRDYVFAESWAEKTVRSRAWKLTFCARRPHHGQLFRVGPDGDETTNLWDDPRYAPVRQELTEVLLRWMVECEQPVVTCRTWEPMPETRWLGWLGDQPRQAELPEQSPPPNEV